MYGSASAVYLGAFFWTNGIFTQVIKFKMSHKRSLYYDCIQRTRRHLRSTRKNRRSSSALNMIYEVSTLEINNTISCQFMAVSLSFENFTNLCIYAHELISGCRRNGEWTLYITLFGDLLDDWTCMEAFVVWVEMLRKQSSDSRGYGVKITRFARVLS